MFHSPIPEWGGAVNVLSSYSLVMFKQFCKEIMQTNTGGLFLLLQMQRLLKKMYLKLKVQLHNDKWSSKNNNSNVGFKS